MMMTDSDPIGCIPSSRLVHRCIQLTKCHLTDRIRGTAGKSRISALKIPDGCSTEAAGWEANLNGCRDEHDA
jgi:hypothetical protein